MPRSSFSDNPLLRVSRPVSACSRCRAAKVKCDGKLPACTACEKAGRESECSAANDQFARGKERSYVAALELRVEKLERRLAYARSRKASVAFHDDGEAVALPSPSSERKDSLAVIRAAIRRKAARKRENSDVNSLVSDFGFLSVNATTRDFEPSVNNMTFARLVLAAAGNDPLPSPAMMSAKLPSRQASSALVQYYLAHVHSLFPFFTETSLLALLEELYHHQQQQPPSHGHLPPPAPNLRSSDYWTLYMVLAIGSSAQSRSRQDTFYHNGVEFAARAMPYADRALAPGHVTQIQSLLLLTLYSMLDPAHFDSWHLIGFTCRAIVDLGFHQDPPQSQNMDAAALDARRRTFYCAYALDRAISMVHARAFSFTDDAINVAFPSMIGVGPSRPPFTLPPNAQGLHPPPSPAVAGHSPTSPSSTPSVCPASLLFQLRRAQSHWYQALYQSDPSDPLADPAAFVWRMCADMREWSEALPTSLPVGIRDMFELELQYSYVYCIAPNARAPLMTAYGRMLIFEHVIAYMNRIAALAQSPLNPVWHTYHDALRVFFMGSQFVAVLRDTATADAILAGGGSVPVPLALPGEAAPPPMPARTTALQRLGPVGGNNNKIHNSSSSTTTTTTTNGYRANTDTRSNGVPPSYASSGSLSSSSSSPSSSADPAVGTNVDRAIACLECVSWTLSTYGARWEDAERLATGFKAISGSVLENLWTRQAAAQGKQQQQQQQPQQQPLQLQQPQQQRFFPPPGHHGLMRYGTAVQPPSSPIPR
ncbi:zn 2cys6 cluster transcripitional activator [Niveomyces insectorum RCEF 264]|uniref:Zn 2cys6 cluster transcripitional activator n=1 Tax=Niveomyces insectorum RCEF 264 TaxID=1081102 RepID=A0A162MR43_9HYPO|nr:zn 2cys6 cluster transcripitional activator [Niveomyces insectorum RCEF 264]